MSIFLKTGLITQEGTIATDGIGDFVDSYPVAAAAIPLDVLMPVTVNHTSAAPAFTIVASYDPSILNLGTASVAYNNIVGAIDAAIQYFESQITTAMTVSIDFGYGEVHTNIGLGTALGESYSLFNQYTYAQVSNALSASAISHGLPAVASSLPASDPTGSGIWNVSKAESKALGLSTGGSGPDGYVGISSTYNFTYDPNNRAVAAKYDAVGIFEHEISEILGRYMSLAAGGNNTYTPFDLFRYSNGVHQLSSGPGYFSTDGGATPLAVFNDTTPPKSGDAADWSSNVLNDAFDAFGAIGVANTVSANDLTVLNALGYGLSAACYAAGTLIRGDRGDVPVEMLTEGDWVETRLSGGARVKWIGQRRIDCARHPDPELVWPVRIAAHAFGPGQPMRHLLLSPDHAVAVDDMLIPIRLLINGASIVQETGTRHVHYFHVELDRHDILLAEGLPAESYLDTGNRGLFANGGAPLVLHPMRPDAADRENRSCLPFQTAPDAVRPIWEALAARAGRIGLICPDVPVTEDPGLHLQSGVRRMAPIAREGGRYWFAIPPGYGTLRLRSRDAAPGDTRPWLEDRRRLGVMVRRIAVHRGATSVEVVLDDPGLRSGWWAPESDLTSIWRWTDGDAALPRTGGPAVLEIELGDRHFYPLDRRARARPEANVAGIRLRRW